MVQNPVEQERGQEQKEQEIGRRKLKINECMNIKPEKDKKILYVNFLQLTLWPNYTFGVLSTSPEFTLALLWEKYQEVPCLSFSL